MRKITILLVLMLAGGVLFAQEEVAEKPEEASGGMTFWQTVSAGGAAMVFIALCSVLALGITIERIMNMRLKKVAPAEFVEEVSELAQQGRYDEAWQRCDETSYPVSNILGAAIEGMGDGKEMAVKAVEDAGMKEMAGIQQKLTFLSVIAVISPMIGLLGTVLGMIQAFNVIAYKAGLGKPTLLAEGISKALITTAFGLIVAIPTMVSYHSLRIKAQNIMAGIERSAERLIGLLFAPAVNPGGEEQAEKELEAEGGG